MIMEVGGKVLRSERLVDEGVIWGTHRGGEIGNALREGDVNRVLRGGWGVERDDGQRRRFIG
jgi:hypothetical protein